MKRASNESPDELVDRLQEEGRLDELETELQRYDPEKLDPQQKESFYRYWGIAAFQRCDRPTAYERFKEGSNACPESAEIRFSLGQEHEHRR